MREPLAKTPGLLLFFSIPSSFSMPLKSRPRLGPIFHLPAQQWQIK